MATPRSTRNPLFLGRWFEDEIITLCVRWYLKQRLYPMPGFKRFENARVVIGGVELAQKIRKHQFDVRQLGGTQASDAEKWQRLLAV